MTGVLVTPRSLSKGHLALEALTLRGFQFVMPTPGAIPYGATLSAALHGCVGWLAGIEPISPAVIDAADRLHMISRNGTGIDNLPLSVREKRQIRLFRAKGTNARGVAELALCLTFAGLRHIVRTYEGMRTGNWVRRLGREIVGAKSAVVGLGAVGATYARMCLDLGARVLGFDPFAPDERLDHPGFARTILDHALVGTEVVSLRAPMPEDGRPLLTAEQLSLLAPDAVVVHAATACLFDEATVLAALDSGPIRTPALDVFDVAPPVCSTLTAHQGVILTSHIGPYTDASVERCTIRVVENLLMALDGPVA
jgi:D-3-phosphoglycerate dehydrogenase / 2-oxoglutarate reductase